MLQQWKIDRDPFYKSVENHFGSHDRLLEAGFFEDSSIVPDYIPSPLFMATPIGKVIANLSRSSSGKVAVLVNTGAYCPVHEGHIEIMERARDTAVQHGFNVVGGYLSPGHDEYVLSKVPGGLCAEERIALCEDVLKESDWLSVDRWEALVAPRAVNFTEVISHLSEYLETHVGPGITVIYVCGGDNARFSLTFVERGHCIVVGRPGYEDRFIHYQQELSNVSRVMWTDGHVRMSSQEIRREGLMRSPQRGFTPGSKMLLRDEGTWVSTRSEWAGFRETLVRTFQVTFGGCEVVVNDLDSQADALKGSLDLSKTISLDPCLPADYNIRISRLFEMTSSHWCGRVSRPGQDDLLTQLEGIPSESYTLFDDDIATGNTIRDVIRMLPDRLKIRQVHSLALKTDNVIDIADCRDYLLGAREGGLVVTLPDGSLTRVPYLFPYVDVCRRTSVPYGMSRVFSIEVWKANLTYYLDSGVVVRDLPEYSSNLLYYLGFSSEDTLEEVCRWHLRNILESQNLLSYIV